jgi:ferredoxin-thioredoxin reductase catalytic subunit
MKLTDLDNKSVSTAKKALSQNYEMSFNTQKLGMVETSSMLNKVRNLMREAKESNTYYQDQSSPEFMKLVFMEQALTQHYRELKATYKPTRIVVENEEVEKSQVVLAAQDMVDSVQKMLEDVSDMLVKELPALSTGISNEMGEESSQSFTQQATEALTQLQAAVTAARTTLQGALGSITGQGGMDMGGGALPGAEMGAEMPGAEAGAELPPTEEPEAEPVGGVGRAKR